MPPNPRKQPHQRHSLISPYRVIKHKAPLDIRVKVAEITSHLAKIFEQGNTKNHALLCLILSCLAHCARPLHKDEIISLLRINRNFESRMSSDLEGTNVTWLLRDLEDHVEFNSGGYASCIEPVFLMYLRARPITGIDRTEETITDLCLSQIEQDITNQDVPPCAFSHYAIQYWKHHYRRIEKQRPDFGYRVHRILRHQLFHELRSAKTGVATAKHQDFQLLDAEICERLLQECREQQFEQLYTTYDAVISKFRILQTTSPAATKDLDSLMDAACYSLSRITIFGKVETPEDT